MLRTLPGLTILCPADAVEVAPALRAALEIEGPVYLRLGKKNEPQVHAEEPEVTVGEPIRLREGTDCCLLSTGTTLPETVAAADTLADQGLSAEVLHVHTVKPLNGGMLAEAFTRFPVVATVEEHSLVGGFGAAVAEWAVDHPTQARARIVRCATPDHFIHESGWQPYARKLCGLTPEVIARRVAEACRTA